MRSPAGKSSTHNPRDICILTSYLSSSANRAAVQGWDYNQAKEEQLWHLERRSKTPAEIVNILCNTPPFRPNGEGIQRINVGTSGKQIESVVDSVMMREFIECSSSQICYPPRWLPHSDILGGWVTWSRTGTTWIRPTHELCGENPRNNCHQGRATHPSPSR